METLKYCLCGPITKCFLSTLITRSTAFSNNTSTIVKDAGQQLLLSRNNIETEYSVIQLDTNAPSGSK